MFLDRLSGRVFCGYSYYYCLSFMGIKSGGSGWLYKAPGEILKPDEFRRVVSFLLGFFLCEVAVLFVVYIIWLLGSVMALVRGMA